jgi:hypothetical protein
MSRQWRIDGVLRSCSCAFAIALVAAAQTRAESLPAPVIEASKQLASLLGASTPVAIWSGDPDSRVRFEADVNRMAYLASVLAGELASGKGRDKTAPVYAQLQQLSLRVRAQSRANGHQLPEAEAKTYARLMQTLQAYYDPPVPLARP